MIGCDILLEIKFIPISKERQKETRRICSSPFLSFRRGKGGSVLEPPGFLSCRKWVKSFTEKV
jgi:hypothetical protein